jgi:tRNA U34 5-carboxymethylaminomethyl modifying enzyme MnmG/GidA
MQDESIAIPSDVDFANIPGLSLELMERLMEARPMTIVYAATPISAGRWLTDGHISVLQGAAKRMEGMTPVGLIRLIHHTRKF